MKETQKPSLNIHYWRRHYQLLTLKAMVFKNSVQPGSCFPSRNECPGIKKAPLHRRCLHLRVGRSRWSVTALVSQTIQWAQGRNRAGDAAVELGMWHRRHLGVLSGSHRNWGAMKLALGDQTLYLYWKWALFFVLFCFVFWLIECISFLWLK